MWEKDKKLLAAYRQCMQEFLASVKEGGDDVDYESACVVESGKIEHYT